MSSIPLDYETLRLIWWALLGILLIGFAVMGGMDLGMGTLLPFVARTDEERRVVLNLSGPTWEGNQVWLVLGGGAIFAAWPAIYAASFSGFYLAMIAILLALILRPVGFKFRGKIADPRWRTAWDWALFVGGFVPSLIFGVAVGNLFLGVPYQLDDTLRASYQGNFFGLLTPFALLTGLFVLANLSIGYTFSTVASNQLQAMQMAMMFFLPNILLSGFMFPFAGMPAWAQWIGEALPLTHYIRIVRAIMLKGADLSDLTNDALALAGLTAVAMLIAVRRFRRTLD